MAGIPGGYPADIRDWSAAGIFYESGRLMKNHFTDMVRVVLLFTFPGSLIKVWRIQFHWPGHQDSMIINVLYELVAQLLYVAGFVVTLQVMRNRIYPDGECSQSFFTTLKLAFRRRKKKAPTGTESGLDRTTTDLSPWKLLQGWGAMALCIVLYSRTCALGEYFRPEAVAEMGLPPWTVFVFTVLVAAITALSVGYVHLTILLLCTWAALPPTPRPVDLKSCG